jgi:predicted dehydrogenase
MQIGIAGAGFMGGVHAASWKKAGARVAGVLAETEDEARPLAERTGARVYTDLPSLLRDVDVLDVCSPTHLHAQAVIAAAMAGRHVVCEKPLARGFDEALAAVRACRRTGVRLFVAHVVRYFPEYALAREKVVAGAVGRVATQRFERLAYRPKKPAGNWFLDEAKSGGIILDLMIHDIDMARWTAGEVSRVYANRVASRDRTAPIDYGQVILTHEPGAISHIAGAWAYPPPFFRTGFEICGSSGILRHDSAEEAPVESWLAATAGEAPDVGLPSSPLADSPYDLEIADFAACIESGRESRVTARDGLSALRVALAAIESAESGRAVEIEPLPEEAL